ncbi:MAG: C40 family peptidase [Elusimicrobia bacterium]|nr:C40 family peptidase [Elusimicrobiota bacterium]
MDMRTAAAVLVFAVAPLSAQVVSEPESPLAKARKAEVASVGAAQAIAQTLYASRTPASVFVNPKDVEAMPDGYKPEDLERAELTYRMENASRKITVVKGSELNRGEGVSWSGVTTEDGKWYQVETRGLAGWVRAEDLSGPGWTGWKPELATAFATRPAPQDGRRTAFAKEAASHLGDNYVWGGRAPGGFDCSGLVQYSMDVIWPGNKVPRVSRDQQAAAKPVASAAELRTGDLVFTGDPVKHVMIFVEDGELVEAMGRKWGVRRSELAGRISGKPYSFGSYFQD